MTVGRRWCQWVWFFMAQVQVLYKSDIAQHLVCVHHGWSIQLKCWRDMSLQCPSKSPQQTQQKLSVTQSTSPKLEQSMRTQLLKLYAQRSCSSDAQVYSHWFTCHTHSAHRWCSAEYVKAKTNPTLARLHCIRGYVSMPACLLAAIYHKFHKFKMSAFKYFMKIKLCDGQWRATAREQRQWPGAKTTEVKAHRATYFCLCFYRWDHLSSLSSKRLHCKLHVRVHCVHLQLYDSIIICT